MGRVKYDGQVSAEPGDFVARELSLLSNAGIHYAWECGTVTEVSKRGFVLAMEKPDGKVVRSEHGGPIVCRVAVASQLTEPPRDVVAAMGGRIYHSLTELREAVRPWLMEGEYAEYEREPAEPAE